MTDSEVVVVDWLFLCKFMVLQALGLIASGIGQIAMSKVEGGKNDASKHTRTFSTTTGYVVKSRT